MLKKIYGDLIGFFWRGNINFIEGKLNLIFHSIPLASGKTENIYEISEERFAQICKLLNEIRDDYFDKFNKKLVIHLTFDDGYKDFIKNACPIIIKSKLEATVFVIFSNLDKIQKSNFLNVQDILEIKKLNSIEIGAHGYYHEDHSNKSYDELDDELLKIRSIANEHELSLCSFSLPYGKANSKVIDSIIKHGFTNIYTSDYGYKIKKYGNASIHQRVDIWSSDSDEVIRQKIFNKWKLFFHFSSIKSRIFRI